MATVKWTVVGRVGVFYPEHQKRQLACRHRRVIEDNHIHLCLECGAQVRRGGDAMKLGRETGSAVNHIMCRMANAKPEVGMGATELCWSDRHAGTIVAVSPSGKTVTVRQDRAIRTDTNGMSELQEYRFEPDPDGRVTVYRRGKRGWRAVGGGNGLVLGERREYRDYSF